ncbi:hypothetical protein ACEYW6_32670 [Nostoc sp. UIC 10607]|uniref:hypothetical protein n=1 Tax=Nostoc sp. UIC 10607 TaxID=3045935 RepID=UPI0039A0D628
MKVLPYDSFTILTDDPLPIVLQRLNALVEPTKTFRFSTKHAPYQGSISESGFQISRIIHYDNSFLPVIRGRFEVKSDQTVIHVQMNAHPFVMAFLGFWFLCWYSAVISMTLAGAMPNNTAALVTGMPILILIIFWGAFWSEANRSRNELTQIIQGQISPVLKNGRMRRL